MKSYLLLLCCCLCQIIAAQQFVEVPQASPFQGVSRGEIAFADVDGDNDQDVIITGSANNAAGIPIMELYLNDGMGNFTKKGDTPFEGVSFSSIAFADVDGDNDQDVLVIGLNDSNARVTKLYTNDGMGNFTEMFNTPFDGFSNGSIAFADIDGDSDQDVLITGFSTLSASITKLYTNDGGGNFTETSGTPFENVSQGSIAFSDVDGDNDQDVLITGRNSMGDKIGLLYTNDGGGNFAEMQGTPFEGVWFSSIAFADVDGDSDQDVLLTGTNNANDNTSKLYTNDGGGNFSEMMNTPFDGVQNGSVAFGDIDGDNDQDVIITGEISLNTPITKLFTNDGGGNFTETEGGALKSVYSSSVAFADVDGDNDQDVIITGTNSTFSPSANIYPNDGTGNFIEKSGTIFVNISLSAIAFADVDGDSDQDLLATGITSVGTTALRLYTNDGVGNFTEILFAFPSFDGVFFGAVAFADVDGDNDQDLLITGRNRFETSISKLYINDGTGDFTEMQGTPFEGAWYSSIAFADVDGDSDQDVLITGRNNGDSGLSRLYLNDGMGNFTQSSTILVGVFIGSVAFADIDGDNDQDLLITGREGFSGRISILYRNNGSGNFTAVGNTPFEDADNSSIAFADVDGDNDQDVLITGDINIGRSSKLYRNNGSGNFTEVGNTPFEGVRHGSIAFADVDGDNDQDVIISGQSESGPISKLYRNDGAGNFTEIFDTPFDGVQDGSVAFGDIDGDNDQDVFITGSSSSGSQISKLYLNLPQGDRCSNAEPVDNLFGGPDNEPQTSSILSNIGYDANGDQGENCFEFDNLDATRWFSFTGDGNTYRIAVPACGGDMPLQNDDSQMILYRGSCAAPQQVACNDDEDDNNTSFMAALTIETQPGVDYRFLVDGYGGSFVDGSTGNPEGQFCLEVTKIGSLPACDNPAIAFDGVDDFVDIGPNKGNYGADDFTFEMMVKTSQTITNPAHSHIPLASKREGCGCDVNFWYLSIIEDGRVRMEIHPNDCGQGFPFTSQTIINDDNWHHVVFTREGDFYALYVDGNREDSRNFPGTDPFNNAASLQLGASGCSEAGFGSIFKGQMDEVRTWNYARSAEEINNSRNRELVGNEDGLTAYYNFNDGRPSDDNTDRIGSIDLAGSESVARMIAFDRTGTNSNWVAGTTGIVQLDRDEDGLYDACNEPEDLPTATRFEELPGVHLGQNYPNPTAGEVSIPIKLGGQYDRAELRFTSVMGKTVKVHQVPRGTDHDERVQVSDLPVGIYFYSLFVGDQLVGTKRMVIAR